MSNARDHGALDAHVLGVLAERGESWASVATTTWHLREDHGQGASAGTVAKSLIRLARAGYVQRSSATRHPCLYRLTEAGSAAAARGRG